MKEQKYNLGLVSVSFRKHSPEEILNAMKAVGLTHIEWGSDIHAPCNDIENLQKIAMLQKCYGIECSSYGTYFRFLETPLEELEHYIKAAKILGTNILRLWCGKKCGEDMSEEEKQALLSLCRKAAAIAENHGVILCMECHRKTFTQNPDDAVWLMESVQSPAFRMYWQPFQWQSTGENVVNAKKISPYTEHIHVFNWHDEEKLPLAGGINDWKAYLTSFDTPRTLLLEFMPNGSLEELSEETLSLKRMVGE